MPIPLPTPASRPQAKSVPVGSPGTKRASTTVAEGGAEAGGEGDRPDRRTTGGDAADEVREAVGERGPEREENGHQAQVATTPATQAAAAQSVASSSIRMDSPTAFSACTVAGQAWFTPTRFSSAR